ncbi:MAG: hypothetical protein AB8B60_09515 [Sulfitobacter sp.]
MNPLPTTSSQRGILSNLFVPIKRTFRWLAFACVATSVTGCAQVTAVPVTPQNPAPKGLPFYGFKPILIVTGATSKVEIIPNLNERYALQLNTLLAKNHAKVTIRENGTIADIDANMDGTAIISFFEKALDKIPTGDTKSASLGAQGEVVVYEFVFHPDNTLSLRRLGHTKLAYDAPVPQLVDAAGKPSDTIGSVAPVDD